MHTLNGTGIAISRTLVFLFEHYQDADGGFTVPDVLRPFTGFDRVAPRKSCDLFEAERVATPRSAASTGRVASPSGGMPERPNGTVLKTVG